jgi:hypothetical protein
MKQKLYIPGVITALIVFTGLVFKINHLAGAAILLTVGIVTFLLLILPLALRNHYKVEGDRQNLPLYIATWITSFIVFMAMLFKILHWPLAPLLITIALPFPYVVFLPVFLIVTSKNRNFSIYNTVFVLMLLVTNSVFSGLLALNVSKNRVDDSFNLAGNYNRLETALNQIPERVPGSTMVLGIDEVLKTVNEYQDIILKQENFTQDQWKNDPGTLAKPDLKGLAAQALLNAGDRPAGAKLLRSLKSLIAEIGKTPGNAELAKDAPVIFDTVSPSGNEEDWYDWKFNDNNLAWVLIYLDGLETNLKMIKATIK